jgi:branched-chain amino acid transport system substrate-binding protein
VSGEAPAVRSGASPLDSTPMRRLTCPAVAAVALLVLAGSTACGYGESDEGKIAFGVLAPLTGPFAMRGQDLVDGAQLAVDDLNVLVSSASSPTVLDPRRAPSTYLLNGTPYQEALAAAHWLALRGVQRLAAVDEDAPAFDFLVEKLTGLTSPVPQLVSRQTVAPGEIDLGRQARAALAARPDVVYWAGSAEGAGRLVAALRRAGFNGIFLASAQAQSTAFAAAAGGAAEGAFVVAPARAERLPGGGVWARRFAAEFDHAPGVDALLAYDAVRALAQAITQTGEVDHALNTAQLPRLDLEFRTLLGPVQFALDHTIQEDNHIVLVVRKGAFRTAHTLRSNSG